MAQATSMAELALSQGVRIDLSHMPLRALDMSHFFFGGANLRRADLRGARLNHANLEEACLDEADLRGTDLTDARNLTLDQLAGAIIDDATILPAYIDRAALLALMANRKAP